MYILKQICFILQNSPEHWMQDNWYEKHMNFHRVSAYKYSWMHYMCNLYIKKESRHEISTLKKTLGLYLISRAKMSQYTLNRKDQLNTCLETECRLFPPVTIFLDLFPCAGYFFNAFDWDKRNSKKLIYLDLSGRFSKTWAVEIN